MCDLGKITVSSEPRDNKEVKKIGYNQFETEEDYVKEMSKLSYDTFNIELADFHVCHID